MKNQNFKFAIVIAILLFMFFESSLYGQAGHGYPGPGNTTIYDHGPTIVVGDAGEFPGNNDFTYIDCEKHPKICDEMREKNPKPTPKLPDDGGDGKKKDKKKKPKKQSLPSGITEKLINEVKQSSKTGMAVIKNGKWVDIFDFDGHIESLNKNN